MGRGGGGRLVTLTKRNAGTISETMKKKTRVTAPFFLF